MSVIWHFRNLWRFLKIHLVLLVFFYGKQIAAFCLDDNRYVVRKADGFLTCSLVVKYNINTALNLLQSLQLHYIIHVFNTTWAATWPKIWNSNQLLFSMFWLTKIANIEWFSVRRKSTSCSNNVWPVPVILTLFDSVMCKVISVALN